MLPGRAILIAIVAICLAVFPGDMSRALVPAHAPQGVAQNVSQVHEGHNHKPAHVHGNAASEPEAAPAGPAVLDASIDECGDCFHDDGNGKGCGKTCCGFPCHAFATVVQVVLTLQSGRASLHESREDRQVDDSLLFSIERPPRSA